MSYTFNTDDLYGLIHGLSAETVTKGSEIQFKVCPYCNGGSSRDKYTFSVSLENGAFNCKRSKCGRSGAFVQLARDFNYTLAGTYPERKYRKFPQRQIVVRDAAVEYMKTRGISEAVTKRYNLTVRKDNPKILVFPFYDEKGEMVFVKYRKTDFDKARDKNKEWTERDAKPILFGMHQCKDRKRLIITEGQIDSLTISECGIDNAVSVPTGAMGFTWIDNCYDFVNSFEEVLIFGDCEKGKITLVEGIQKRFPKKRLTVVRPEDYLGEKDANDIFRKFGKEAIATAIANAKVQPVKAAKDLSDVKPVNLMQMEHIRTGVLSIDKAIGGLYLGQVGLLTGKRGEGKSTFASQICANVLEQGYSIFAYSGELPDYHFKNWLDLQIAGNDKIKVIKNEYNEPESTLSAETQACITEWYRGRAYIFDNSAIAEDNNEVSLLDTVEEAICRYGCKFILLDNLMTALDVGAKDDLFLSQSRFVKKLKRMAQKWDVFILIVAHPRKESGELNNDSVSGSSDITNAVDIVITYSRNTGEDREAFQSVIGITKNRLTGKLLTGTDRIKVEYSSKSKRIAATIGEKTKVYSCFKDNAVELLSLEDYD